MTSGTSVIHAWWQTCRCGHVKEVHRHHRHGDDCSLCDCDKFKHQPKPPTAQEKP